MVRELQCARVAVARLLGQRSVYHPADGLADRRVQLGDWWRNVVQDGVENGFAIPPLERPRAAERLVADHSQREDIGRRTALLAHDLLRSHVADGTLQSR